MTTDKGDYARELAAFRQVLNEAEVFSHSRRDAELTELEWLIPPQLQRGLGTCSTPVNQHEFPHGRAHPRRGGRRRQETAHGGQGGPAGVPRQGRLGTPHTTGAKDEDTHARLPKLP